MSHLTDRLEAILKALRSGHELANAVAWKKWGQIAPATLTAFLSACFAIARFMGYDLGLSDDDAAIIGAILLWVLGAANAYLTQATSPRLGPPPRDPESPP